MTPFLFPGSESRDVSRSGMPVFAWPRLREALQAGSVIPAKMPCNAPVFILLLRPAEKTAIYFIVRGGMK